MHLAQRREASYVSGTPERLVGSLRLYKGPPDLHTKIVGILLISFLPYSQDPEAGSRTLLDRK